MKVSAMATKVCATITAVVGAASFHRLLPIGAVRRGWATGSPMGLPIQVHIHRLAGRAVCHLTKAAGRISFSP